MEIRDPNLVCYAGAVPYADPLDQRARDARNRHYAANREQYAARRAVQRSRAVAFVREQKTAPCMDCHRTFPPVCMDFDHREAGDKTAHLSKMANNGAGLDRLRAEIAKCDLVCSNCHRIRTAERGGW